MGTSIFPSAANRTRPCADTVAVGRAGRQVAADHPDPDLGATLLRRDRDNACTLGHDGQRYVDCLVRTDAVERRGAPLGCGRTDPCLQPGPVRHRLAPEPAYHLEP